MIWLNEKDGKERDIITCNMIVLADGKLKMIEELKKELMNSKNYVLSCVDVLRFYGEFPFDTNNGRERIENQKLTCVDRENLYVRRYYTNPRSNCLEILNQVNLSKTEQLEININLLKMLNGELEQIDIMEKVYRFFSKKDELRFFMNKLWQDFYFFAKDILDVIELEEISKYDVIELEDIQRLCKKNNIQDNCSEILVHKDVARTNGRILKLAKKINDSEKWWENH